MNGESCGKDRDGGVEVKGYCGYTGSDREECRRGWGCKEYGCVTGVVSDVRMG